MQRIKVAKLRSRDFTGFYTSKLFISSKKGGIIMKENKNLDNQNRSTQPNVRLNAPSTPKVTMIFRSKSDPNVNRDVASLLLSVFTKMQGSEGQ